MATRKSLSTCTTDNDCQYPVNNAHSYSRPTDIDVSGADHRNFTSRNVCQDSCFMAEQNCHCFISENAVNDLNCETNHTNSVGDINSAAMSICTENDPHEQGVSEAYPELVPFLKLNLRKLKIFHLNVNSLRNKFLEVNSVLQYCDVLCLTETKLDDSFSCAQFNAEGFKIIRNDRNEHGGGILCYVRSTIPHRNREDISYNRNGIESIVIEIAAKTSKIMLTCIYRPPSIHVQYLQDALSSTHSKCLTECNNIYILGDLNVNFLKQPHALTDTLQLLDLCNIIVGPTCFKNATSPTLIDVILTNRKLSIADKCNVAIGISDFHHLIGVATKMHVQKRELRTIFYRSFKHFDENQYVNDLRAAPLHVSNIFDDVDDQLWYHNSLLKQVTDDHAPLKVKRTKGQAAFYMNDKLRKTINVKSMLRRKYEKFPNAYNWSKFKSKRNEVNKLKRDAMKLYFDKKCNDATITEKGNNRMFWEVVKPYFSSKIKNNSEKISLFENNDTVLNDPEDVCNVFNDHFVSVTNDMCESIGSNEITVSGFSEHYSNHPSVVKIRSKLSHCENSHFSFRSVDSNDVFTKLRSLNPRKSCGFDLIPAKFLRLGANVICKSLTPIINESLESAVFPTTLKQAEVSPIFKKGDPLLKGNYRPVSILTSISKIFEKIIHEQLSDYFQAFLNESLAAYRKNYSCENVLLQCVEDWRGRLDAGNIIGCLMIDLSKAFDCLPHGLLITKMEAYGLTNDACHLLLSYLSDRRQRVKLADKRSNWQVLPRGVPQGSLLGPLLFNIFMNDYFHFVDCQVYNYADDVTLSCHGNNLLDLKLTLEDAAVQSLDWFAVNLMKANPDKFQAMCISRQNYDLEINVHGTTVKSSECVKLLGVLIDRKLTFGDHVSVLCKRVGKQVNAFCRLSRHLNEKALMNIYNAFILSNFNYATTVWHLCGKLNTRKIEKLQERSLRIIFKDYESDYKEILKKSKASTLYLQRTKKVLIMVFKIIHDIGKPFSPDFFQFNAAKYNFRDTTMLLKPKCNTSTYGLNSFLFQAVHTWNNLPISLKLCEDISSFRSAIAKWDGPLCSCGSCLFCTGF